MGMNSWQKRNAANGLCIFCTRQAAEGSGGKAPKCKFHREAIRKLNGHAAPYLSWASRRERRASISNYALAHPFSTVKKLAGKFRVSEATVAISLKQNKVVPGWRLR
jgi:hypothetical protein